ncbi:saccharopine dehydrogenase NADP-binding domain-containing protein [Verrucosispora sp. WMMA2121]|uniref:saccharopine dehydrogenase family protein n=1 Tax=Verrucosispora sp. WMMA2121 TaxID=3015164 RepID=UPI0022B63A07|nr:saccharopine dehydrogenase NADP-binding domain-containing protein [Verrucosispora sp. WMMA2121]MCZ7423508.1 saccharopine dehydrogenase NADP-binding domain-containing protein [Verrucosispora sp. WMMA2121]
MIGGYGAVGRVVATTLARDSANEVVVAGRDLARAEALARSGPGRLTPRRLDLDDLRDLDGLLADAAVVVMCVEHRNETVARACLDRGVPIVDISASADVLAGIERLEPTAKRTGTAAVLSVGLAPELTNVLARRCAGRLPSATSVDVTVLLGTAGDHGPDSVRWTVAGLTAPFDRTRRPGRARVDLPGFGLRTVHPFPFSDQYTLSHTLGVPVTTRLCLDSAAVTATLFWLRGIGAFHLADRLGGVRPLTGASNLLRLGGDRFVVHVSATDGGGRQVWAAATGRQECHATGVVAAEVALGLMGRRYPPGVRHIDQVVDAGEFLSTIQRHGLTVHEHPPPSPTGRIPATLEGGEG